VSIPTTAARPRVTFIAAATSFAAVSSLQSLMIPVLSIIGADIGADAIGLTWTLTAWLIAAAVATPLLGRAGDLIGRRRMYLLALTGVAVGTVLAAFAPNLEVMLIARVLQGLGGAVFPLGFGLIRDVYPPERMPGAIGALAAVLAVGSGLGTVIAGPIAAAIGWRGLFVLPFVLAVTGLLLGWRGMVETADRIPGRIRVLPALLLSAWLVALLLPLSAGNQWGWGSPLTIALLVAAVLIAALWVRTELRSDAPLVDMRMMRMPAIWTTNLTAVLTGAAMFGAWAYLPRIVEAPQQNGFGLGGDATLAGIIMLPMLVLMAGVGFVAGPLSRIMPFRLQLVIGALVSGASVASIAVFHHDALQLTIAAAGLGLGTGLVTSSTPNLIVRAVRADQVGIATGMNANVRTIGGAIGTTVYAAAIGAGAGASLEAGYVLAFAIGGVLAAVGGLVPLLNRSRPRRARAASLPVVESPLVAAVDA
jgi:MFS family permease